MSDHRGGKSRTLGISPQTRTCLIRGSAGSKYLFLAASCTGSDAQILGVLIIAPIVRWWRSLEHGLA